MQECDMETKAPPQIVTAERMGGAIFIEFDDGNCGLYSGPLLYELLPEAAAVGSSEPQEDEQEDG